MDESAQKQQFQRWLLKYVNGSLGKDECSWMNQYLVAHPQAAKEVEMERALKTALSSEMPDFAPEQGLHQLMSRVRAETTVNQRSKSKYWLDKLLNSIRTAIAGLFQEPKWAVAVALLLVQTGVITAFLSQQKTAITPVPDQWRSINTLTVPSGPVLQITFKPTATEEEMRLLLVKIRGTLLGGPGQLGNYIVKVPEDTLESARQQAANAGFIESVQILKEVPLEP